MKFDPTQPQADPQAFIFDLGTRVNVLPATGVRFAAKPQNDDAELARLRRENAELRARLATAGARASAQPQHTNEIGLDYGAIYSARREAVEASRKQPKAEPVEADCHDPAFADSIYRGRNNA